eukprot:COSAG06_NODE_5284_length_3587_cov_1.747420_2_plen_91_part_00
MQAGTDCHANIGGSWAESGGSTVDRVQQGETVGLLLSRGELSVCRNGFVHGVLCVGLSGSLVWAADLCNEGDAVRILPRPVPATKSVYDR